MSNQNSKKFVLKEVPVDLKRGFLTRYWNSPELTQRQSFLENFSYFLSKAFSNIKAMPFSNFLSVLTVAFSLFLLGGFILVLKNFNSTVADAGDGNTIVMYLKRDLAPDELSSFSDSLKKSVPLKSFNYVSKEQALEILRKELSENQNYLKGLEAGNPLPASIELRVDRAKFSNEQEALFVEAIEKNEVISDVFRESQLLQKIQKILLLFKFIGLVIISILFVVVSFLVSNTVRLVVLSRVDEIKTMRMVGATSSFVQVPYVLSGAIQGLLGSLLGLFLLYVSYLFIENKFSILNDLPFKNFEFAFVNYKILLVLVLLGTFIGALASFLSTRKISQV